MNPKCFGISKSVPGFGIMNVWYHHGVMVPWCGSASMALPWCDGLRVCQWYGCVMVWWCGSTIVPWCGSALVLLWHGVVVPWCDCVVLPWCHGVIVPWWDGVVVPWWDGVVLPWCHGVVITSQGKSGLSVWIAGPLHRGWTQPAANTLLLTQAGIHCVHTRNKDTNSLDPVHSHNLGLKFGSKF